MDELKTLLKKGAGSIEEIQAIRMAVVNGVLDNSINGHQAGTIRAFLLDIEQTIKG
jgi:hypothetical protein